MRLGDGVRMFAAKMARQYTLHRAEPTINITDKIDDTNLITQRKLKIEPKSKRNLKYNYHNRNNENTNHIENQSTDKTNLSHSL